LGDEMSDMADYILKLERPLTVKKLAPLIGVAIQVRKECNEWGKRVVDTDSVTITNINLTVDVESGNETSFKEHIYMDYYLEGRLKYNAWGSLECLKDYIQCFRDAENNKPLDQDEEGASTVL